MIRTPTIDVLNPIDWTDADNAGLQLALLGLPIYAGGRRWADATGRTSGGVLTARSATLPAWSVLAGRAAVRLDGSNHVVGSRADLSGPFAIKITLSGATTADFGVPLGTSASDWYFQRTGSACSFTASIGGSFRSVTIPSVFDGQPKRLAVIYTGQVLQGFRNGILVVSTSATGLLTGPKSTVNIGVLGASGNPMTGVTTYSDVQISSYLFDAGHATRDYEWSLDPSRDPRMRRLTGVATFGPLGGPSIVSGSCEIFAGTGVEIATGTNLGATTDAAGSTVSVSVLGCLPVGEAVLPGGVIFDPIGAAAVCAVVAIVGITALDSATGSQVGVNTNFGGGATWSIVSGSLAIGSGVFQCGTVFVGSMQTVVPLAVVNTIVIVGQICRAYSITTSIAHTVAAESYVCRTITLERS
jgi:hypothetical protein